MTFALDSLKSAIGPTVPDSVYAVLHKEMLEGQHPPGSALKQDEIAARLGVSKIPIREALSRLETEGLVEQKPRRGFFAASFDLAEIEEIFDLRAVLEELAGRLAAAARTREEAATVTRLADEMAALDAASPDYHARWCRLNQGFHEAIIAASHKKHVIRLAMQLRHVIEPYIRLDTTMSAGDPQADEEHREIAAAFASGNAELVGALSAAHCYHTRDRLVRSLRAKQAGA